MLDRVKPPEAPDRADAEETAEAAERESAPPKAGFVRKFAPQRLATRQNAEAAHSARQERRGHDGAPQRMRARYPSRHGRRACRATYAFKFSSSCRSISFSCAPSPTEEPSFFIRLRVPTL